MNSSNIIIGPGYKTWNGGSATTDNWTDKNNWGGTGLNFGLFRNLLGVFHWLG